MCSFFGGSKVRADRWQRKPREQNTVIKSTNQAFVDHTDPLGIAKKDVKDETNPGAM